MGGMKGMAVAGLAGLGLTGPIPSLVWGSLRLLSLDLSSNFLQGSIPPSPTVSPR